MTPAFDKGDHNTCGIVVRDLEFDDSSIAADLNNLKIGSSQLNSQPRKKRSPAKSIRELVRQPDKQGVERFVDPSFAQGLGEIEAQIHTLMQEYNRRREAVGESLQLGEEGQGEWYESKFYKDMTAFYKPPVRKRMETKPTSVLRSSKSKMGTASFMDTSFNVESPTSLKNSKKRNFRKSNTTAMPGNLAMTDYNLPAIED